MERVNFWTSVRCSSGIHASHRVHVTAVYDTDDDGSYMRVESVGLLPWERLPGLPRWAALLMNQTDDYRTREVKDKLGVLELRELVWQAQEQYGRDRRAEARAVDAR